MSRTTWLCGICAREISASHVKRHLAAHDRHGTSRAATDEEWLAFLDATGWPADRGVGTPSPVSAPSPTTERRDVDFITCPDCRGIGRVASDEPTPWSSRVRSQWSMCARCGGRGVESAEQ